MEEDWAVAVLVRTERGIVCIQGRLNDHTPVWKLIGGKRTAPEEEWQDTAITKLRTKAGIIAPASALSLLFDESRRGYGTGAPAHHYYFCEAHLASSELQWQKFESETGEPVRVLNYEAVHGNSSIFLPHARLLNRFDLIKPPEEVT